MSDDVRRLSELNPWGDVVLLDSRRQAVLAAVPEWEAAGLTVGVAEGRKARRREAMFGEFGRALRFPAHAEPTWDSFTPRLAELAWLPRERGVVLVVLDAHRVLDRVFAPRREATMEHLMRTFHDAANTLATPIAEGNHHDRAEVAFHLVLQASGRHTGIARRRWGAAGAMLRPEALPALVP